jgi:hypothetical protein
VANIPVKKLRRSVRAKYCFSEKEHAEIARRRDSEPRPALRAAYRAEARIVGGVRGRQAVSGQTARSSVEEGTDTQERCRASQEQTREGYREINERERKEAPQGASFFWLDLRGPNYIVASSPPHLSQYHSVG